LGKKENVKKETQIERGKNATSQPGAIEWQINSSFYRIDKKGANYTAPTRNPLTKHSEEIGSLITTIGLIKGNPGATTVGATTMSQSNAAKKAGLCAGKTYGK
jgi:hypothetical protein